jgi:hypothetical protein
MTLTTALKAAAIDTSLAAYLAFHHARRIQRDPHRPPIERGEEADVVRLLGDVLLLVALALWMMLYLRAMAVGA